MAAPTRATPDPARASIVERARKQWIERLTDLSRRNNLLYFRDLKTGTLDLTGAEAGALHDLLKNKPVPFAHLFPDDTRQLALLREIERRALTNLEEKGLKTLFLAVGMATWTANDGGRPPEAAVLLLPIAVQSKGREGTRLTLQRDGDPQVNLVLLQVLAAEHGCPITPEELLEDQDEEEGLDEDAVCARLISKAAGVKGFGVQRRVVLGNFSFQKMAMVNDLRQHFDEMLSHDLIAAIAGDRQAAAAVAGGTESIDPRTFDLVPPDQEFLVVDADSSQQEVIALAERGQHGVIQGPPGTGKSQTIVNLMATLAAQGKRILFVAEKRAALDVVKRRLDKVGLGHLVLDLHGAEVSRREIMERVSKSLRLVKEVTPVNAGVIHERVQDRRTKLGEHDRRMHTPRRPSGYSVYDLQGALLRLPPAAASNLRWRGEEIQRLDRPAAVRVQELLQEAGAFAALFLKVDPSPWTPADLPDGASAQRAVDLATTIASDRWPALQAALEQALRDTRLPGPATLVQALSLQTLLTDVKGTLARYQPALYQQDLGQLTRALAPAAKGGLSQLTAWLLRAEYRAALRQVRALARDGKVSARRALQDLQQAADQAQRWGSEALRALGDGISQTIPAHADALQARLQALRTDADALMATLGQPDYPQWDLGELQRFIRRLVAEKAVAERVAGVRAIERDLQRSGAGKMVGELRATKPPAELWPQLFTHAWLSSCLDLARTEDPALVRFSGAVHSSLAAEFSQYDRDRLKLAADRVRRAHAEHAIAAMNEHPEQEALVRREADKQRRHMQLRKLLAEAPDVLMTLFPCWMASPLSVSQLIDADRRYFDVVLFDEASQVLPEDAIPALLRASQAVVAGDQHQLPPSTFFADGGGDEEEEAEGLGTEGYESLLKVMASATGRSWWLKWHYRSQDEALIAFSNRHIYDDQLVTFPGVGGPAAISHVEVAQELGRDGQEESSGPEVRQVVALILEHAATRPHESLGVIAMGLKHANRIQALLDSELKYRPELDAFFDESKSPEERFFVKNLERVQGDERDAIILTVGYGKDRAGKLPYRFGPLLHEGGERRLNVAITRAKRRLTLVSSFSHHDMDPGRSKAKGVELLRLYLQYAASNGRLLGDRGRSEMEMNPFEQDVYDALRAQGISLEPQWGVSNYRLDFAVKHPTQPGRFVLAIECDGANYHSAPTARDRDRLRQQHLELLGWRFHRIWSTDWFTRREEELQRTLAAYHAAVAQADQHAEPPAASDVSPPAAPQVVQVTPKRGVRPPVPVRESIDLYGDQELVQLVQWIQSDGRLRTDDEILREMVTELGFKRRGSKIEERVTRAIAMARAR